MKRNRWVSLHIPIDLHLEKLEDKKFLKNLLVIYPFGRMGWGAPLRDAKGHIIAERGNIFDREPTVEINESTSKEVYANIEVNSPKSENKEGKETK